MRGQADVAELLDGIPQDGATLGDPRAEVEIVEFADLQCPACRAFSQDAFAPVIRRLVRPGPARLTFRNWPILGPDSRTAALSALAAARQDRMHDFVKLF